MASPYRYLACDITTGAVLHELPLTGVAMQTRLGGGTFSAALPLTGTEGPLPEAQRRDLIGVTVPLGTSVVAMRNGLVVGEWQIVKRHRLLGSDPIAIEGVEILGHLGRRYVTGTLYGYVSESGTEYPVDQFDIARAIIGDAYGGPGGIALDLGSGLSGGQKMRLEWDAGSKTAEDALLDLANTEQGFDYWTETVNLNPEGLALARYLRLAYPRAGVDRPIVFDIPTEAAPGGTVSGFDGLTEDGELYANGVYAIGKDGLLAHAETTPYTIDGRLMPITETTGSWSSVETPSVLAGHAAGLLADSGSLYGAPTLAVLADGLSTTTGGHPGPVFGDWRLGDRVRVHMPPTLNFPNGLDQTVRVIGWTLTPPAAGPESVALEIDWTDKPNASAPTDLIAVMADTRRRLRDLETH